MSDVLNLSPPPPPLIRPRDFPCQNGGCGRPVRLWEKYGPGFIPTVPLFAMCRKCRFLEAVSKPVTNTDRPTGNRTTPIPTEFTPAIAKPRFSLGSVLCTLGTFKDVLDRGPRGQEGSYDEAKHVLIHHLQSAEPSEPDLAGDTVWSSSFLISGGPRGGATGRVATLIADGTPRTLIYSQGDAVELA